MALLSCLYCAGGAIKRLPISYTTTPYKLQEIYIHIQNIIIYKIWYIELGANAYFNSSMKVIAYQWAFSDDLCFFQFHYLKNNHPGKDM